MSFSDFIKGIPIVGDIVTMADDVFRWIDDIGELPPAKAMELSREGSDQSLPVVYGQRKVGGVVVHKWSTSSVTGLGGIINTSRDNAYLHMIVAFAQGEIEGYESFIFGGEDSGDQQFNNAFYIAERYGSGGQTPIPEAVNNIPNWENTMVGNNVAYCYFCFYQDKKQSIWRGEPQIQAVIKGRKLYDPRLDATAYSDNNALAALDYLTNNLYGRGLQLSEIDIDKIIDAADFCDELTNSTVNSNQWVSQTPTEAPTLIELTSQLINKRYQINAIIDTNQKLIDNYRQILQSFRAYPKRGNGKVSLGVETVGDPVMTFDSALNQINGDIDYVHKGQKDRYNRFTISFPSATTDYEMDERSYPDIDSQIYADWLAEDNGKELEGRLEVNTLTDVTAALQSAEIAAKASRFGGVLRINVDSRARLLEGGDIIGVSDVNYGWTDKPFRVLRATEQSNNTFDLELKEHENSVYPWGGSQWSETEGGTWLGNPYLPQAPTNLILTQDTTLATTGRLTWNAVNDSFVRSYRVVILNTAADTQVRDDVVSGESYTVPLIDVGNYNIYVYSITTEGLQSDSAIINVTLAVPSIPTSLNLTVSDWDIVSEPLLSNIGLGTSFEFDIVQGNGSGHTPESKGRASSFTFSSLLPNTQYTVFARTVNAYGESNWVNQTATTTITGDQVAPFIDPIQDEIDEAQDAINDLESDFNGLNLDNETLSIFDIESIAEGITDAYQNQVRISEIQTTDSSVTANTKRIELVEIDSEGNAIAINALSASVETAEEDISANTDLIQSVELTANNNASAITVLDTRVSANEDFASAQLILNAEYEDDIGVVTARAFLGVDVNDRVTGINIEGSVSDGVISFIGDKVEFLRPTDLSVGFQWDAANNTFVFDGKIIAVDSTFTGTVTGSIINGTTINGGTINGADGNFTGTVYASEIEGDVVDVDVKSFSDTTITTSSNNSPDLSELLFSFDIKGSLDLDRILTISQFEIDPVASNGSSATVAGFIGLWVDIPHDGGNEPDAKVRFFIKGNDEINFALTDILTVSIPKQTTLSDITIQVAAYTSSGSGSAFIDNADQVVQIFKKGSTFL